MLRRPFGFSTLPKSGARRTSFGVAGLVLLALLLIALFVLIEAGVIEYAYGKLAIFFPGISSVVRAAGFGGAVLPTLVSLMLITHQPLGRTMLAAAAAGWFLLRAPVASIGGAGTFDGIFLTGLIAVLLAQDRSDDNNLGDRAMTQAELWQLQLLAVSNSIDGIGVLLTVISGYLVAAYFVGNRLSRYQAAVISVLFLLGTGLGSFMTFVQIRRTAYFIEQLKVQFGVQSLMPNTVMVYLAGALLFLLVPAALFFMYQIRRNPRLGAVSAPHV